MTFKSSRWNKHVVFAHLIRVTDQEPYICKLTLLVFPDIIRENQSCAAWDAIDFTNFTTRYPYMVNRLTSNKYATTYGYGHEILARLLRYTHKNMATDHIMCRDVIGISSTLEWSTNRTTSDKTYSCSRRINIGIQVINTNIMPMVQSSSTKTCQITLCNHIQQIWLTVKVDTTPVHETSLKQLKVSVSYCK